MASMEQFLGKKYKLKSSDNFEEYLKVIDVGMIARKTAMAVSPVASLELNPDGTYSFIMVSSLKTIRMDFRLGEEFVETRADGAKMKAVMTIEENKLIQTSTEPNGRKSLHIREFTPNQVIVTSTADGWDGKSVRIYELVQ